MSQLRSNLLLPHLLSAFSLKQAGRNRHCLTATQIKCRLGSATFFPLALRYRSRPDCEEHGPENRSPGTVDRDI